MTLPPARGRRREVALAASAAALVALGGCISLLPKQKPAQLYRFGAEGMPAAPPTPTSAQPAHIAIRAAPTSFERAAGGDRILTVRGDETAYIGGARWVSAAAMLFDDAVTRAFETRGGPARLLARDEPAVADYVLKLDVRTFEARYDGRGAGPTVVVEVYAALVGRKTAETGVSHVFRAEARADENAVHAIATAFDSAVGQALGDMVAWVETTAAA